MTILHGLKAEGALRNGTVVTTAGAAALALTALCVTLAGTDQRGTEIGLHADLAQWNVESFGAMAATAGDRAGVVRGALHRVAARLTALDIGNADPATQGHPYLSPTPSESARSSMRFPQGSRQ